MIDPGAVMLPDSPGTVKATPNSLAFRKLGEARLRVVRQHHVKPLHDEHFAPHPGLAASYDMDRLLDSDSRRWQATSVYSRLLVY
jgi:hypothetical protein